MNIAKQLNRFKSRKLLVGLGTAVVVVLLLGGVGYASRGWIREEALPSYYDRKHKASIQAVIDNETTQLNEAIKASGLHLDNSSLARCSLDRAKDFRANIFCWGQVTGSATIDVKTRSEIAKVMAHAAGQLEEQGWQKEQGLLATDWTGEIGVYGEYYFSKQFDYLDCNIQLYDDAYDMLDGQLGCSANFKFLGDPYK